MSDEQDTVDKAADQAGAGSTDMSDTTQGGEPSAPPAPPRNKQEATEDTPDTDTPVGDPDPEDTPDTEDTPKEDAPLDTSVWGSTGDETGDSVLGLLQNAGVSVDEAKALLFDAVKDGDLSKVDVSALEEKVGKNQANLIMIGAKDFLTQSSNRAAEIVSVVTKVAGGEDNWSQVTEWAKTGVPEAELNEYRDMIDAGGVKARLAASDLVQRFNADDKNTTLGAGSSEIVPDTSVDTAVKVTTRTEYFIALKDAHARGASEAEINKIKAARAKGRSQGI